jgi:putative SOS response-associated peptidase YedK
MCYSISNTSQLEAFKERYKREMEQKKAYQPTFFVSGFSFPNWPVVTQDTSIKWMQWGLLPRWLKADHATDFAAHTLNARGESLHEKPSFKHLVGQQPCLIPVTSFYEYQTVGKEKIPYRIFAKDTSLFSIAGLWDTWTNPLTGSVTNSFTLITTKANPLMAEIHNSQQRMPLILDTTQENTWLDTGDPKTITPIFDDFLTATLVNKHTMGKNSPDILQPYIPKSPIQGSLF